MEGRTSPINSPKRAGRHFPEASGEDESLAYSPLSNSSPLQKHRDTGFYASPTSSTRSYNRQDALRQSNTSSVDRSHDSGSLGSLPPPPSYSSPSRSVVSNATNDSKYSSLMQYLESEIGDDEVQEAQNTNNNTNTNRISQERGYDELEDEDDGVTAISSMSLSPHKEKERGRRNGHGNGHGQSIQSSSVYSQNSHNSKSTRNTRDTRANTYESGKTYIWDEWNGSSAASSRPSNNNSNSNSNSNNLDGGGSNGNGNGNDNDNESSSKEVNDSANPYPFLSNSNSNNNYEPSDSDTLTYFSTRHGGSAGKKLGGSGRAGEGSVDGQDTASLRTIVAEVKIKVEGIKDQILQRTQQAKGLQVELVRVHTARKRRMLKFKKEWEIKLQVQRDEQREATSKISDFTTRLQADVQRYVFVSSSSFYFYCFIIIIAIHGNAFKSIYHTV